MDKREEYRHYTKSRKNTVSFAVGELGNEIYDRNTKLVKSIISNLLKNKTEDLFSYTETQGLSDLRRAIKKKYEKEGFFVSEADILITTGCQQALKLICDSLLTKEDTVILENSTYIGIFKPLIDQGVKITTFDKDLTVMKTTDIENKIKKNRPKLIYIVPDFANPTGKSIDGFKRDFLIGLASKYKFIIVEDLTYRDLAFNVNSLSPIMNKKSDRVIFLGSLSKVMVPGLRIGWTILKDKKILNKLISNKEAMDLSTSKLDQKITTDILETMLKNPKIIEETRNFLAHKMKILKENLEKKLPKDFLINIPEGGFFAWIEGPKNFMAKKKFNICFKDGVNFIPGDVFNLDGKNGNCLRLSVNHLSNKDIKIGTDRLVKNLLPKRFRIFN